LAEKQRRKSHENTHPIASYRIVSGFLAGWSGAMPFLLSIDMIFSNLARTVTVK
jgi:hypothetical protein